MCYYKAVKKSHQMIKHSFYKGNFFLKAIQNELEVKLHILKSLFCSALELLELRKITSVLKMWSNSHSKWASPTSLVTSA